MFKRIRYGSEPIVKIKIEDESGAKMGDWTIMMSDLDRWANLMRRKYGVKNERDLDWIN